MKGSAARGFIRFKIFLKAFTIAKELKFDSENIDNKHYTTLVFVYDKNLPAKEPIVYSSINKSLKSLLISYGSLMEYVTNKYIFKDNFILSFEPLSIENFTAYNYKPYSDHLLRKNVIVFKKVLFRKKVFVFDCLTLNLIIELKSITEAFNYAKVNFYTMKNLLKTNKPYNNKIYSFSKTLPIQK